MLYQPHHERQFLSKLNEAPYRVCLVCAERTMSKQRDREHMSSRTKAWGKANDQNAPGIGRSQGRE